MRHFRILAPSFLLGVLAGCVDTISTAPDPEGTLDRECEDGRDNDNDGLTDCRDSGCAEAPICQLGPQPDVVDDGGADDADAGDDTRPDDAGTDAEPGDTTPDGADPDGADGAPDGPADVPTDAPVDPDADGGTDVPIDSDADAASPGPGVRSCVTRFTFRPPAGAESASVAGAFNGWSATANLLADPDRNGVFEAELDLEPGEYAHKFTWRMPGGATQWEFSGVTEIPAPVDFYTQWDGGNENRNVIVGDCNLPLLQTVTASGGTDGISAEIRWISAADGAAIDLSTVELTVGGEPADYAWNPDEQTFNVDVTGLEPGKHSIRLTARDVEGRTIEHDPHFIPLWVESEPFEWRDATMYFVFTDRFRNGDVGQDVPQNRAIEGVPTIANYQGGDFLGVIQAIEEGYFDDLGVNLLWLSPVTDNPDARYIAADRVHQFSGFHGYWPTSARRIEFRWGDAMGTGEARLKQLIDTAHAHGIRVMFDIALNHVHEDHDYVSSFPSWFTAAACPCTTDAGACNWDTNPIYCWFIDYLPDLDYKNHAIVEQVSRDVEWLVTEFDVDSFRIDAAKHMDHVIMRRVAMRLEERFTQGGGAPFYLVGETFTGGDGHGLIMRYVNDHELDAQFDFPLLYGIRDAFAFNGSLRGLSSSRATSQSQYGSAYFEMSPFLGNHDIPRFAQLVYNNGGYIDPWANVADPMRGATSESTWNIVNRMSLAFLFVLTQPGVPLIYYGDEIGLYGGGDPDNRRPMVFEPYLSEPNRELLGRVQAIGQARREHEALRRGTFQELWVDDTFMVYARNNGGGDVVIVAFNKGAGRVQNMPVPTALGINGRSFVNTLADVSPRRVTVTDNNMTVTLSSWEYAIFVAE